MKLRLLAVLLGTAGLLAGCTSVVNGTGSVAPSHATAPTIACPHVVFPTAKLSFDCITTGMSPALADPVWPLAETRTVDAASNWVLEEGAGHWGSTNGRSLDAIAKDVRGRMISAGGYGDNPKLTTVADKATTVDGAKAQLLQTTVTIDPTWARHQKVPVKQEKLWILAIEVGNDDVSLWFVTLPDLVRELWPKVPATIATVEVG